ncbi:hypothetical protein Q8791_06385 [Nocardiopsis sp. CT-R113]|uniref:Uncharacterized protein n=1 Tax=Nocardiopsis codii TaxID=3065942 RepID=A0ABU7K3L6_9ACTN|nr:hypothetical protein [Nocardiopsis sp. CT-R113]MEE2036848.1 hypothetical protein [Nocardiopsis sp. CT-R113]
MAPAALVLYLLGIVLAFGVRTLAAWRRTGDTGFRRPDTTALTAPGAHPAPRWPSRTVKADRARASDRLTTDR